MSQIGDGWGLPFWAQQVVNESNGFPRRGAKTGIIPGFLPRRLAAQLLRFQGGDCSM
jgi:hypothetical protein